MVSEVMQQARLEKLLHQDVHALVEHQRSKIDQIVATWGTSFILFGAGRLGKIALAGLRQHSIEPIAFADNNSQLWGKSVDELTVLSPQEAIQRFGQRAVFVVTVYTSESVRQQLRDLGAQVCSLASLAWKYPEGLLPHAALDLPYQIYQQAADVQKAFDVWADDVSRREYLGQLEWRTSLDPDVLPPHLPPDQIYFPNELVALSPSELLVDCGAFDGDSVRDFLKHQGASFSHILAIEADPHNYQRLQASFSAMPDSIRSKLTALNLAVGARQEMVRFDATGTAASTVGSGTFQVECLPLDIILKNSPPTYIKMDIEGAEPDALLGARQTMERHLPVMAICLYHRQEHLWQIPLFIQSMSSDYRLFLRRYSDECWELVCYAIPINRLAF